MIIFVQYEIFKSSRALDLVENVCDVKVVAEHLDPLIQKVMLLT